MTNALTEADLYDPVRRYLEGVFQQRFEKCYLETSSDGFSERMKSVLETDTLLYLSKEGFRPDLTGYVTKGGLKRIIVVEIKKASPRLRDIYQAKMYAELFGAHYGLLVSPRPIQEELRRLLTGKPHLYGHSAGYKRLLIGQFDLDSTRIPEGGWFPDSPFRFE